MRDMAAYVAIDVDFLAFLEWSKWRLSRSLLSECEKGG